MACTKRSKLSGQVARQADNYLKSAMKLHSGRINSFQYQLNGGATGEIILPYGESEKLWCGSCGQINGIVLLETTFHCHAININNVVRFRLDEWKGRLKNYDVFNQQDVAIIHSVSQIEPIVIDINCSYYWDKRDTRSDKSQNNIADVEFLFHLIREKGCKNFFITSASGATTWFKLDDVAMISVPVAKTRAPAANALS